MTDVHSSRPPSGRRGAGAAHVSSSSTSSSRRRHRKSDSSDVPRERRKFPAPKPQTPLVDSMTAAAASSASSPPRKSAASIMRRSGSKPPTAPERTSRSRSGGSHVRSSSLGGEQRGSASSGGSGNGSGGDTPLLLGMIVDRSSFDSSDTHSIRSGHGRGAGRTGSLFRGMRHHSGGGSSGAHGASASDGGNGHASSGGHSVSFADGGAGGGASHAALSSDGERSDGGVVRSDTDGEGTSDSAGTDNEDGGGDTTDDDSKDVGLNPVSAKTKRKNRRKMKWRLPSKKTGKKKSSGAAKTSDCNVSLADASVGAKSFHTMGSVMTAKQSNTQKAAEKKKMLEGYRAALDEEVHAKQKQFPSLLAVATQRKKVRIQRQLRKSRGMPFASSDTRPPRVPDLSGTDDDGDQQTEASGRARATTEGKAQIWTRGGRKSAPTEAQGRQRRKARLRKAGMRHRNREGSDSDYDTDGSLVDAAAGGTDTEGEGQQHEHCDDQPPSLSPPISPGNSPSLGLTPHRKKTASVQVKRERMSTEDSAGFFGDATGGKRGRRGRDGRSEAADGKLENDPSVAKNHRGVRFDSLPSWDGDVDRTAASADGGMAAAMITPPTAGKKKHHHGVPLSSRSGSSSASSSRAGTVSTASLSDVSRSLSPEFGAYSPLESPAGASKSGPRKRMTQQPQSPSIPLQNRAHAQSQLQALALSHLQESPKSSSYPSGVSDPLLMTPPRLAQSTSSDDDDAPPPPPPLLDLLPPLPRWARRDEESAPNSHPTPPATRRSIGSRPSRPPLPPSRLGSMAASSGLLSNPSEYLVRRPSNGSLGNGSPGGGGTKIYVGADDVLRLDDDDGQLDSLGSLDTDDEDDGGFGVEIAAAVGAVASGGAGGDSPATTTRQELARLQAMSEGHIPDRSSGGVVSPQPAASPATSRSSGQGRRRSDREGGRGRRRTRGPVDLDDDSILQAELNLRAIHDLGARHLEHGEYDEAVEVFREIYRGQRERYGPDHPRVGTALHNVGIVLLRARNYELAVDVCRTAVEVRGNTLGTDHPDVAVSLAQLGIAHLECGQHKRALVAFREALRIRRARLGPKHPKVAKVLNNVGCSLFELGELRGAMLAFQETLEIQRSVVAGTNPASAPPPSEDEERGGGGRRGSDGGSADHQLLGIAATQCNIGSILLRLGRHEESVVALEEALLIQQSVLGDDHPTVLSTLESIEYVDKAKGAPGHYGQAAFTQMRESARGALEYLGLDEDKMEAAFARQMGGGGDDRGDAGSIRVGGGCAVFPPALAKLVSAGSGESGCRGGSFVDEVDGIGRGRGVVRPIREQSPWGTPPSRKEKAVDAVPPPPSSRSGGYGHLSAEEDTSSAEHDLVSI